MKRTKSMTYENSVESQELVLYVVNDFSIYERMILPVIENLRKKVKKNAYDPEKAVDAFYPVATEASKRYNFDFGYMFSVKERFSAAVDLVDFFEDQIKNN